jgi:hypothetical protein
MRQNYEPNSKENDCWEDKKKKEGTIMVATNSFKGYRKFTNKNNLNQRFSNKNVQW